MPTLPQQLVSARRELNKVLSKASKFGMKSQEDAIDRIQKQIKSLEKLIKEGNR